MTTANDISIVLSGGSSNSNPSNSIGGAPSSYHLTSGVLNNLFDDITPEETTAGVTDYRCVYVFNDGTSTVFNVRIWIYATVTGGGDVSLGILAIDEVQRIVIDNTVTGGNLVLSYAGIQFTVNYESELSDWAQSIQNSLNTLLDTGGKHLLREVEVSGQLTSTAIIFDVLFTGQDGSRSHEVITVVENNLTPSVDVESFVATTGSPVNSIPSILDLSTTPPGGVSFVVPTSEDPIVIPKLAPNEGFPLWLQREVASGTAAVTADGITFRLTMNNLDPLG